jgi:hypothetical protein
MQRVQADLQPYAITCGGPLRRVERVFRISRADQWDVLRRAASIVALSYVPFLAVGVAWRVANGTWSPALQELATHLRGLLVAPLLLVAEIAIDVKAAHAGRYLQRSRLVGPECAAPHRAAIARTTLRRDSPFAEALLLTVALVTLVESPAFTREVAPVIRWTMLPGLLLYRFLALRLLWRWLLWAVYLGRLSRLPLTLRPTHPDRVGGLAPLAGPSLAFAILVAALASFLAATWADRMRFEGVPPTAHLRDAIAFILVALAISVAPLLSFSDRLVRTRALGVRDYGALAHRFTDAFERTWFRRSGDEVLHASEIQSLNDLGGSFERLEHMRIVVAPRALVEAIVAAAVVPMLPLAAAELGAHELLLRLAKVVL